MPLTAREEATAAGCSGDSGRSEDGEGTQHEQALNMPRLAFEPRPAKGGGRGDRHGSAPVRDGVGLFVGSGASVRDGSTACIRGPGMRSMVPQPPKANAQAAPPFQVHVPREG